MNIAEYFVFTIRKFWNNQTGLQSLFGKLEKTACTVLTRYLVVKKDTFSATTSQ